MNMNVHISIEGKLQMYDYARPIMTYGAELSVKTRNTEQLVRTHEINTLFR